MNRAIRLAMGISTSGLVKEEAKAQYIVIEQLRKLIAQEKNTEFKRN